VTPEAGKPAPTSLEKTATRENRLQVLLNKPSFQALASALGGIVLEVVFYVLADGIFSEGSFGRRLFMPAGRLDIVPKATMLLFFWSMCLLVTRGILIRKQRAYLRYKFVLDLPSILDGADGAAIAMHQLAAHPGNQRSILLSRILLMLQHWTKSNKVEYAHEFLKHQSDIDSDSSSSSYALLRVFIWAMPILGFIGTVIGISLSVGGFSEFLTGQSIDKMDVVRQQLAAVAKGLSFAFDTTFLGLVSALLTMIITSLIQNVEENFLTAADSYCLNNVIGRIQQPRATGDISAEREASLSSFEAWLQDFRGLAKEMSVQMSDLKGSGLQSFEKIIEVLQRERLKIEEIERLSFQQELQSFSKSFRESLQICTQDLGRVLKEHNQEFARYAQELQENGVKLTGPFELKLLPTGHRPRPNSESDGTPRAASGDLKG
jgi:biopolymer transport protein ExbB/TolQ